MVTKKWNRRIKYMINHNLRNFLLCTLILCLPLSGCSQAGTTDQTGTELEGAITISGAWALYPLMVRWGEEFQKIHPDVRIDISAGGAGKGMADALSGAVDIGMVSRQIHPEEIQQGAFWISVTKDAVFITVSDQNPVLENLRQQGIERDTLVGIYITGEITTWGEVVGLPDVTDPIHVFTRSDACGAGDTWAQYLGKKQEDLLGIGVYGDPGVLDTVIKDPLGIGYNNLNYAFDFETSQPVSGAFVVSLDVNGNSIADPDELYATKDQAIKAVATDLYPSPPARDLNLVTFGQPTGLVRAFLVWILTDGQQFVTEAGYIPFTTDKLAEELAKLD
jgi:phosphate transport system substrate-binding protein